MATIWTIIIVHDICKDGEISKKLALPYLCAPECHNFGPFKHTISTNIAMIKMQLCFDLQSLVLMALYDHLVNPRDSMPCHDYWFWRGRGGSIASTHAATSTVRKFEQVLLNNACCYTYMKTEP